MEDKTSELKDKIEIKGETEELLDNTRPVKGRCKN
jgi:hypothetical protein